MRAVICVAVMTMAIGPAALASRQPVPRAFTYVDTISEGLKLSQQVFGGSQTQEGVADANGRSLSVVNYPQPAGWNPSGFASTSAGADVAGMAKLDIAAGLLHLSDSGWINCGADSGTSGWLRGSAQVGITDVITLDQPARVTIAGHISGSTFGLCNGDYGTVSSAMGATFGFWEDAGGEIGWRVNGYQEIFSTTFVDTTGIAYGPGIPLPQPFPISQTVSYSLDLPAGSTYFTALLDASINLQAYSGGSASTSLSFENTAHFALYVPEGVTATSQSGMLPISVPEPTSLSFLLPAGLLALRRVRH